MPTKGNYMLIQILSGFAALGAALVAGTFFAFSTFVMGGLARLEPARAAEAMRWINQVILGSAFMPIFGGVLLLIGAALAASFFGASPMPARAALLIALGLYATNIAVTLVGNVPLNDALEAASDGATAWSQFHSPWLYWNHVRGVAATGSVVALMSALQLLARG